MSASLACRSWLEIGFACGESKADRFNYESLRVAASAGVFRDGVIAGRDARQHVSLLTCHGERKPWPSASAASPALFVTLQQVGPVIERKRVCVNRGQRAIQVHLTQRLRVDVPEFL